MLEIYKLNCDTKSVLTNLYGYICYLLMNLKRIVTISTSVSKPMSTTTRCLKPFSEIPGPKPLPLIGNIWRYFPLIGDYRIDTLFENALYNKKRYGHIVREQITSKHTILHLFDPEDIISFHRQDSKYPHRRSHRALLKYRRERPDLYRDGGLFPENGPNWLRQRNQFKNCLMNKNIVGQNALKLDDVSLKVIDQIGSMLADEENIKLDNFDSLINKWALHNSLSVFLDLDMGTLDDEVVDVLMKNLNESLEAIDGTEIRSEKWVNQSIKCPFYKQLVASQDILHEFVESRLEISSRDEPDGRFSYLKSWLHDDKLDMRDIVSFVIDSLHAGLHTSAYTFAFLLYHVTSNKDIMAELVQEIRANIKPDETITTDVLDKMKFLRYCLKETLRVNPVSIGTGRLTHHDSFELRGFHIPKGTMIIAQSQVINMDGSIFEQPEKFNPHRWGKQTSISPFAYLPFGFGSRSCIGQKLSEIQIKIMTIRLLQRFDLEFCHTIKTKTTMIHSIDGNIRVNLKRNPLGYQASVPI